MSDIVERLTDWARHPTGRNPASAPCAEAAAEIERLRAERAKAVDESQKAFIEAETLRAWLRKIAAIENNDWGGDWEEIDTARAYARAALNQGGSDEQNP